MDRGQLDAALIAAHEAGDRAALVRLYRQAGEEREQAGDIDAACFYYTHAYVFALESGHGEAAILLERLVRHGREIKPD
ncbi:hypothetical protein [Salaquimonas pukyongi]|uniref:hypothetical protein n=1 Tax=Salaquimonas pukyongi TaxID=2712698 RepID=UPI00096BCEF2|nr:hypothetical protein [Salaquimonas pukyongi]